MPSAKRCNYSYDVRKDLTTNSFKLSNSVCKHSGTDAENIKSKESHAVQKVLLHKALNLGLACTVYNKLC